MAKVKVEVEIPDGKYCRESRLKQETICNFFWESEDGDTGCCLLDKSTFIEGDISQVPKFDDCPNRMITVDEGIVTLNEGIFAEAVRQWGVDSQVMMGIEEMAELMQALLKMRRQDYQWGNPLLNQARDNMAEEIADVELMLEQLKYMFEIHTVPEIKQRKMERLKGLLKTRLLT